MGSTAARPDRPNAAMLSDRPRRDPIHVLQNPRSVTEDKPLTVLALQLSLKNTFLQHGSNVMHPMHEKHITTHNYCDASHTSMT